MIFNKKKKINKLIDEIEKYVTDCEELIDSGLEDLYLEINTESEEKSFETKEKFARAYGILVVIKMDILEELRELNK